MEELEQAFAQYLKTEVLVPDRIMTRVTAALQARTARPASNPKKLTAEIEKLQAEQKRLAKAVAMTDEVAELASALQANAARVKALQAQLGATKRTPLEAADLVAHAKERVAADLQALRDQLDEPEALRQVLLSIVPDGIRLSPARHKNRGIWNLEGLVNLSKVLDPWFNLSSDPDVEWPSFEREIAHACRHLRERPAAKSARSPAIWVARHCCTRRLTVAANSVFDFHGAIS
jgi:hypothetical protein